MHESPIFTRTHDLLCWLIPLTVKFPRGQRFVVAGRLQQRALDFQEQIIEAGKAREPLPALRRADVTLAQLRAHFRLSKDLELISIGQYEHGARMMSEVGRRAGAHERETARPGPGRVLAPVPGRPNTARPRPLW